MVRIGVSGWLGCCFFANTRPISMSSQTAPIDDTMHGKWPRRIWLPGVLMEMIPTRMQEVGETTLSRYLVELISYDLRERREHSLTGWLATLPLETHHSSDRFSMSPPRRIVRFIEYGP